jgi:aspartokinase/homoserine dehydrogenase 1
MADVGGKGFLLDSQMEGGIDDFMDKPAPNRGGHASPMENRGRQRRTLKYVGSFDAQTGRASTGLTTVPADHPFFNIEGTDNIVLLTTDRYAERSLIIQGAGAGAAVTDRDMPDRLKAIIDRPKQAVNITATYAALKDYLLS